MDNIMLENLEKLLQEYNGMSAADKCSYRGRELYTDIFETCQSFVGSFDESTRPYFHKEKGGNYKIDIMKIKARHKTFKVEFYSESFIGRGSGVFRLPTIEIARIPGEIGIYFDALFWSVGVNIEKVEE